MLRHEDVDSFNNSRDTLDTSQLSGGDYRGGISQNECARPGFLQRLLQKLRFIRYRLPRD